MSSANGQGVMLAREAEEDNGEEQPQDVRNNILATNYEDLDNIRDCGASTPTDESEAILRRLTSHLRNPEKFIKASKLLRRLLVQPDKSMVLDGKTVPHMQS